MSFFGDDADSRALRDLERLTTQANEKSDDFLKHFRQCDTCTRRTGRSGDGLCSTGRQLKTEADSLQGRAERLLEALKRNRGA